MIWQCLPRETAPCGALGWQHPADLSTSQVEPALCWVCYCRDIVAKVENRTTLKISRKLIFGLLSCCVAFQRPTEVRDWSLTSPRVKHISGSRNFHSSPQKDFCNSIVGKADIGKACRLTDHFQLACLNLSHGLKWRAGRGRLQWTYHVIPAFVWNALQLERLEFGSYSARPDRANRLRTC
jgi:hypothetical protein